MSAALLEFTSHVSGKNAKVSVYPDRVELRRGGLSLGKLTGAVATFGASALVTGGVSKRDEELIPVGSITSVSSRKGLTNTVVSVVAGGSSLDFKVSHSEAQALKDLLLRLMAA